MSFRINLLQNQKDYNKLDNVFRIARIGVVIMGAVCFVALIVLFGLKRNAQSELREAQSQLEGLQAEINTIQEAETRIILINEKMQSLNRILDEQPDYSKNVETFLAFIPDDSGILVERMSLSENTIDFIVSFDGILPLSAFLSIMESPKFQQYFERIKVDNIDVSNTDQKLFLAINVTF